MSAPAVMGLPSAAVVIAMLTAWALMWGVPTGHLAQRGGRDGPAWTALAVLTGPLAAGGLLALWLLARRRAGRAARLDPADRSVDRTNGRSTAESDSSSTVPTDGIPTLTTSLARGRHAGRHAGRRTAPLRRP